MAKTSRAEAKNLSQREISRRKSRNKFKINAITSK